MNDFSLKDYPDLCAVIERIVNNGGACEVKKERGGKEVTVVEIDRKVKYKSEIKKDK